MVLSAPTRPFAICPAAFSRVWLVGLRTCRPESSGAAYLAGSSSLRDELYLWLDTCHNEEDGDYAMHGKCAWEMSYRPGSHGRAKRRGTGSLTTVRTKGVSAKG